MLIPIGHVNTLIRRMPWVTFGLMILCVLVFLLQQASLAGKEDAMGKALERVLVLHMAHPGLKVDPQVDAMLKEALGNTPVSDVAGLQQLLGLPPADPAPSEEAQAELDAACKALLDLRRSLPQYRFGFIPSQPSFLGLFTHQFLHGGWLHLLGNLFFLYLAGPLLEDLWGRPFFAGFYLVLGAIAALIYRTRYPGLDIPLIGASGAISALLGAFLVRLPRSTLRFAYFFVLARGTFTAPAMIMLPLWFLNEYFNAYLADAMGGQSVAYWAHVGGFAAGAMATGAIRYFRLEDHFAPALDELGREMERNLAVLEARRLRELRRSGEAVKLLRSHLQNTPDDAAAAIELWNLSVEQRNPAEAAPAIARLIRTEVGKGDLEAGLDHFLLLRPLVPEQRIEPAVLVRLAGYAVTARPGAFSTLLPALLERIDGGPLHPGLYSLAENMSPTLPNEASELARRLLDQPELKEADRQRLLPLVRESFVSLPDELPSGGLEPLLLPPPLEPEPAPPMLEIPEDLRRDR